LEWRWESWPAKRPLYGLQRLAEKPFAPVVVCEGEKAADAAGGLLPDFVVVTSSNGCKSAGNADWSPLRGRTVIVWPDADAAGLEYAKAVAKQALAAGATAVATVSPPDGVAVSWDAADVRHSPG
jgi:putative DNA primase/helicase